MPLEIVWSPLALARLREIRAYIAQDKPGAAEKLAARIVALAEVLRRHPNIGHDSGEPGVRELVVGGTPFTLLYRARAKQIVLLDVRHAARHK